MLTLLKNPYVIMAALALLTFTYTLGRHNGYTDAETDQEKANVKMQKDIDRVPDIDSAGAIAILRRGEV